MNGEATPLDLRGIGDVAAREFLRAIDRIVAALDAWEGMMEYTFVHEGEEAEIRVDGGTITVRNVRLIVPDHEAHMQELVSMLRRVEALVSKDKQDLVAARDKARAKAADARHAASAAEERYRNLRSAVEAHWRACESDDLAAQAATARALKWIMEQ